MSATAERTHDTASADRFSRNRPIREGRCQVPPGADGTEPLVHEIRWDATTIALRSDRLFGEEAGETPEVRRRTGMLIERLFAHEAVSGMECDRKAGVLSLRLRLDRPDECSVEVMRQLIRVLLGETDKPLHAPVRFWDEVPATSFELNRYGRLLTFWKVRERTDSSLTLVNPRIAWNPLMLELVEDALIHVEGVQEVIADVRLGQIQVNSVAGQRLDERLLLHSLEQLEAQNPLSLAELRFPRADLRWPALAVALAAGAQWLNPAIWPVAAALIIWLNLPMLRRGVVELRQGILGLPILTVLIVSGTMIGGALFAASLMTLTSRFWQNRYFSMLALAQSEWLGQLTVSRGNVVKCLPDGTRESLRIESLKTGDVIEIKAPESIPADGEWIDGEGEVIHAFGESVVGNVTEGDVTFRLYAGGWLREGRIRMRVNAAGELTRARRVRREILRSSGVLKGSVAVNEHGQAFAEKTVKPTLALAGLGLATVGLSEAVAVLRPDYAMGVGMGEGLQRLRLGAEALYDGFLLRNPGAVLELASIDLWIVEPGSMDGSALDRICRNSAVAEIRGASWIDLTTAEGKTSLRGFAPLDGDEGRVRLIRSLRTQGAKKIGWIGDAESLPLTASAVDIAMSTNTDFESAHPAAAIVNLASGREPNWGRLFEIAAEARGESLGLRMRAIMPNVAAVGGAFLMGLDSLAAVLLTNFGIYSVHRKVRKPVGGERRASRGQEDASHPTAAE